MKSLSSVCLHVLLCSYSASSRALPSHHLAPQPLWFICVSHTRPCTPLHLCQTFLPPSPLLFVGERVGIRGSMFSDKGVPGIHVKWWKKKSYLIPAMTCGWSSSVQPKSVENTTVFANWGPQPIYLGKDSQVQQKTRFLLGQWALPNIKSLHKNTNDCAVISVTS